MADKPMTLFLYDGRAVKVEYIPDLLSFVHQDMRILNPFRTECGRFYTSPKHYGFYIAETGGRCQAYDFDFPNGDFLRLTTCDGLLPDEESDVEDAIMGLYTAEDFMLAEIRIGKLPQVQAYDVDGGYRTKLLVIRDSLQRANSTGLIIDTIWSVGSPNETLFDFIEAALDLPSVECLVRSKPDLGTTAPSNTVMLGVSRGAPSATLFKKGDIVRYGSGPSALMRLDTPHVGGWHGIHCLGGFTFSSTITHATPKEVETFNELRAKTLAQQGRTE